MRLDCQTEEDKLLGCVQVRAHCIINITSKLDSYSETFSRHICLPIAHSSKIINLYKLATLLSSSKTIDEKRIRV